MSEAHDRDFWDDTAYVVVYLYRFWDPEAESFVVSRERATLDAIKSGLGSPMTETGIKVPRMEVDMHGRHRVMTPYQADN